MENLAFSALAALTLTAATPADECGVVSKTGLCQIHFGMNLAEAMGAEPALTGLGDVNFNDPEEAGCFYLKLSGSRGDAWLMFVDDKVSRVDVFEPGIVTAEGAAAGMTLEQIREIYPQGKRQPNHYNEQIDDMHVDLDGGMMAVFEAYADDVVHSYRVGYAREAQFVEGCS